AARVSPLSLNVLKPGCAARTSMRAGSCRLARAAGNLGWIQNRKVTCQSRNTIDGASSQTNDTNKACGVKGQSQSVNNEQDPEVQWRLAPGGHEFGDFNPNQRPLPYRTKDRQP